MAGRDTSFSMTAKVTDHSAAPQHSPWHSPVPYLFGGLAAMLGLIAFALLILACSYWKLSGYLENNEEQSSGDTDLEAGEGKNDDDDAKKAQPVLQEKFLVIMAGEVKPTFLATPVSSSASTSRSSSFGDSNKSCSSEKLNEEEEEEAEKKKDQPISVVELQSRNSNTTHESSDQTPSSQ